MELSHDAWKAEVVSGATTLGFTDWLLMKREDDRKDQLAKKRTITKDEAEAVDQRNRDRLFDALKAAGVETVVVEYSGYGDSGQIDSIDAEAKLDGHHVEMEEVRTTWESARDGGYEKIHILNPPQSYSLRDVIEKFCYDKIEEHHPGYENNEGGNGTFTFNVADRSIHYEHNDAYIEYEHSEHEV